MRLRPSTAARGYGPSHQALRRFYAPLVASGLVDCARCQERISPTEPWDLGHDDHDRRRYTGPEHRYCNRAAAARKRNMKHNGRRTSRPW